MIPGPSGVRVWLATGHTDMIKGFPGLALVVQETLKRDPHNGHLFVFRSRRDDQGACLFSKELERGRFIWPSPADGTVTITPPNSAIYSKPSTGACRRRHGGRWQQGDDFGLEHGVGCDSIASCPPLNRSLPTLPPPTR